MNKFFCFAAVFFTLTDAANAEPVPNGVYQALFGGDKCGILTSTSTALAYTFGQCGKLPEYTAQKVNSRENRVKIDKASYEFKV